MMRATPTRTRPGQLRHAPATGAGPRGLRLTANPERTVGPGDPPPGFLSATTSRSEWVFYWALAKAFRDPREPRLPPFFGGRDWGYQIALQGGRREPGGSVVDYIIYLSGEIIGIRLQTDRFHIASGPEKQAYDEAQLRNLSRWMRLVDVYEQDIIGDPTGEAAVRVAIEAIGGRGRMNPIRSAQYRRVRAA